MWTYQQDNGLLTRDGVHCGTGYSGHGEGRNNPAMEAVRNVGPIPRGKYTIGPFFDDPSKPATATTPAHSGKGPIVCHLIPDSSNEMRGRAGFMIHGNNATNDASHGCIIFARLLRELVRDSKDTGLTVV